MTDCFFFPDDPVCNEDPVDNSEDPMMDDGMKGDMEMDAFSGQTAYTLAAASWAAFAALDLYRYRPNEYYDTFDDFSEMNWWSLANYISNYASLTIGSVLFIF
jgi:hypothetical protein